MCESQSEKAFNEKLARSQWISKQAYPTKLRPMPPVVLSQEIGLSPEGQRERKNYFTAARYLGIAGVIMLLSPFIYAALLSGYHGNNEDGLAWGLFFMIITFFPIGLVLSAVALIMFDFGKNLCK
ncbi:hypothetical protein CJ186_03210 [Actinomyces graevenitzii]|uniref:hypothetical protein n=1 Tax=Actinomyces graevenitzii TaxID=55565 RepID=UPI000C80D35D|nr:hypothetical protein [Actinomyces graevenitzii]PMC92503.1 hypothetical protein CJ186_03210 [Actinomyces graevenitzii]